MLEELKCRQAINQSPDLHHKEEFILDSDGNSEGLSSFHILRQKVRESALETGLLYIQLNYSRVTYLAPRRRHLMGLSSYPYCTFFGDIHAYNVGLSNTLQFLKRGS